MPDLCDTAKVVVWIYPQTDTIWVDIPQDSSETWCVSTFSNFSNEVSDIIMCEMPENGTLTIVDTCITYQPDSGYVGFDTICLYLCEETTPGMCDTTKIMINVLPPVCLKVNTWVYLQGSSVNPDGGETHTIPMRSTLNDIQVLPGQTYFDLFSGEHYTPPGQPYSGAPWNYPGEEGLLFDSFGSIEMGDAGYPPTVVDWVLVSLRDTVVSSVEPVCQAAALLHTDGRVEFVEPFDCCGRPAARDYYITIEHRNHLIVMSSSKIIPVNDTLTYDFRSNEGYLFDPFNTDIYSNQMEIMSGVFAMIAGNGNQAQTANSDTDVNFLDNSYFEGFNGLSGQYLNADYNMNGDTNFNDRALWEDSNGKFTSVVRD